MRFSIKNFLLGLGAGAALTLLILNAWGRHYANEYLFSMQPRLLQPFLQQHLEDSINSQSSAHLPSHGCPDTAARRTKAGG